MPKGNNLRAVSDAEVKRIDAALTTTGGIVTEAAVLLGIDATDLGAIVRGHHALSAKWSAPGDLTEPTPGEAVDRTAVEFGVDPATLEIAQRDQHESQKLARIYRKQLDWESIGISGDLKRTMDDLQAFTQGKVLSTMDVTHGSMMKAHAVILNRFDTLTKKLEESVDSPELQLVYGPQWESCAKLLVMTNKSATDAAKARAYVAEAQAKLLKAMDKGKTNKRKLKGAKPAAGGGNPKPQSTNPNGSVEVTDV